MDADERISLLEEAEELLHIASDKISKAAAGTTVQVAAHKTLSALDSIIDSDDAGSVKNLKKNIEHEDGEQPIWTRPLVSVKNADRRDI